LRKIVGRKEVTKIAEITSDFIRDAVAHGETQEVAEKVAEQVKAAGRYIFNRSHAVSYGMVSYITAYLKSYYPREYLCAILNSKDDQEKSLPYIKELKRLKIPVLPPDLSVGNRKWTLESDGIRVGLEYIKGVGKNLNTTSVDTFESVVSTNTKTCVIPCIKAGALDYLGLPRGALLANFATTQDSLKRVQQCQEKIQQYTGDPKKQKLLESWQEKLRDAQGIQKVTPEKYDVIAGECEVLSFSFHEIPKVKVGKITNIYTKNDKNGRRSTM
jgi:DNA polymerase-3 subunit alpha